MNVEASNADRPSGPPPLPPQGRGPAAPKQGSRAWPWVLLLVLLVAAGGVAYYYRAQILGLGSKPAPDPTTQAARGVPVVTAVAQRGDMPVYIKEIGTVTALNTVAVHTRVDGELLRVAYTEGQIVQAGQLLAEIDPRPFEVQLTQAQGQKAKDQASLANARLDLQRYQTAQQAVTQQQIDTAKATVAELEGAVQTDQGQIDSANLNLKYCKVTAPLTGMIGLRLVDQGNIVHASDVGPLAVITQVQPIAVIFPMDQDFLPQVLKARRVTAALPVDAFDRDGFKTYLATGTLQAIDSQIDTGTDTVRLKALFENKAADGKDAAGKGVVLYPNQFVNIRLLVDTKRDTVLVPVAAIQRSPLGTFVYVVQADHTVAMRAITVGPVEGETASVVKDLEPGEVVVTDGVEKLEPGKLVVEHAAGPTTAPTTQREAPTTRSSR